MLKGLQGKFHRLSGSKSKNRKTSTKKSQKTDKVVKTLNQQSTHTYRQTLENTDLSSDLTVVPIDCEGLEGETFHVVRCLANAAISMINLATLNFACVLLSFCLVSEAERRA